jgi:hypothetical protein
MINLSANIIEIGYFYYKDEDSYSYEQDNSSKNDSFL